MKTQLLAITTAAAATTLLGFSAPAQAYGFSFGTSNISFKENTKVEFTFLGSGGANISSLGIFNVNNLTNPVVTLFEKIKPADVMAAKVGGGFTGYNAALADKWKGTFGNSVIAGNATQVATKSATVAFTFLANQVYTLGLFNQKLLGVGSLKPNIYSTSSLNGGSQQVSFGGAGTADSEGTKLANASTYGSGDPFPKGGVTLGFEDTKGGDKDFNDFRLQAEAVPEPITMAGLALGFSGMVAARRRRNSKTA